MVSTISNDVNIQQMMQMFQKMKAADTDGTSGLSKSELSSIDSGSDVRGADFLKSLTNQFDSLDADKNGQLSASEIATAKPPEGGHAAGSNSSTDSIEQLLEKLLQEAMQAISDKFKNATAENDSNSVQKVGLANADTDGTKGLSLAELSSLDTSKDAGKANFVNNLINNFKTLDKDNDGQLTQNEIQATKITSQKNLGSEIGKTLGQLSASFAQKLINSYQSLPV